ncbi:hypothetical protein PAXRUDRAFT_832611 [Paxillus rubicundulus Ve08.2h10]|uniref:Uncharacterized protein n=1 Tax=Paxillus rubicundulus Ve08.2h10 TaxID=930991 RepID=A0A0D0CGB7_9AGAM|nr:hypothetical protein PAXRUDRAFT_832611 [Paxillus rubicundulus Ve08.2h10]
MVPQYSRVVWAIQANHPLDQPEFSAIQHLSVGQQAPRLLIVYIFGENLLAFTHSPTKSLILNHAVALHSHSIHPYPALRRCLVQPR